MSGKQPIEYNSCMRLEIHYTPIHASWLNIAEIEIGILSRQCPSQSLASFDEMLRQVNAWVLNRNSVCSTVRWRFFSDDARCKLRKLWILFHLCHIRCHQHIQRCEHGTVVYRFPNVHLSFSFPAQVRLFSSLPTINPLSRQAQGIDS